MVFVILRSTVFLTLKKGHKSEMFVFFDISKTQGTELTQIFLYQSLTSNLFLGLDLSRSRWLKMKLQWKLLWADTHWTRIRFPWVQLAAYENILIQSLCESWEKQGILKVAVIRAVLLRECRLRELALYLLSTKNYTNDFMHALHSLSCHSFATLTDYEIEFRELPLTVSFENCYKWAWLTWR